LRNAPPVSPGALKLRSAHLDGWAFERVRAEIDLVVLQVTTLTTTNFQTVSRRLTEVRKRSASARPVYVQAIAGGPGGGAREFEFAVQDVRDLSVLTDVVGALDASFGLASPPLIRAIEFAMDLYPPLGATDREGGDLTVQLARRLFTGARKPRQIGPGTNYVTVFVDHGDAKIVADATTYFGHRIDDLHHKVYWKEKDCGAAIDQSARRARVEVRVSGAVLLKMGLRKVSDLASANFRKLLAAHFRFRRARQMGNAEGTGGAVHGLLERAGVGESHGMSSFEAYRRTRRGRVNKYSKMTQADRFMTRRVGDALDGLTDRFTEKVGEERLVASSSMKAVCPMYSVIADCTCASRNLVTEN